MASKPKKFTKLDAAIYEARAFIEEAEDYKKKRNTHVVSRICGSYYKDAGSEHGTLVHRSILLAKKLVAWRKNE